MSRETLLTTLPSEMWTLVCNSVSSPSYQTTLMQSCSYFNQLQADIIPTSLFPKLLFEVMRYLDRENLFLLRRICRNWRTVIDEMLENAIKTVGNPKFGIRFIPTMELTVNYIEDLPGTQSLIPEDLSRYLETSVNPLLGKSLNVKVIFRNGKPGMDTLVLDHLRTHGKHVLELKLFMRKCNGKSMAFQMWQYLQFLPNLRKLTFNGHICYCSRGYIPNYVLQQVYLPFLEEVSIATWFDMTENMGLHKGLCDWNTAMDYIFMETFCFNFTNIKRWQTFNRSREIQANNTSLSSLTDLCIINPGGNLDYLSPYLNALKRLTIRCNAWRYPTLTVYDLLSTTRFEETLNFLHIYFKYFRYSDICATSDVTLRLPSLHTWKFTNCSLHRDVIREGGMIYLKSLHKIQIVQEDPKAASLLSLPSKELLGSEDTLFNIWNHSASLQVVTFENCVSGSSHQWKFWSRELYEFHNC